MPKLISASIQQRNFVTDYLKHGNRRQAYRDNYAPVPEQHLDARAKAVVDHPMTRKHIHRVLNKAGATPNVVSRVLGRIMGEVDNPRVMGQVTPSHVIEAAKETAKLQDMYPAEKRETKVQKLSLNLEGKSMPELTAELYRLRDEIATFTNMIKKGVPDAKVVQ